jgi:hypothetical protein
MQGDPDYAPTSTGGHDPDYAPTSTGGQVEQGQRGSKCEGGLRVTAHPSCRFPAQGPTHL